MRVILIRSSFIQSLVFLWLTGLLLLLTNLPQRPRKGHFCDCPGSLLEEPRPREWPCQGHRVLNSKSPQEDVNSNLVLPIPCQ
jgi:hypothetical protein